MRISLTLAGVLILLTPCWSSARHPPHNDDSTSVSPQAGSSLPYAVGLKPRPIPAAFTNSIGMKLTPIPAGEFLMGSPSTEDGHEDVDGVDREQLHRVRITKPFYMGVYPVTQQEYEKVIGSNPSYFCSDGNGATRVARLDTSQFPVESVSWDDAQEFCSKLSQREGKIYRLPTEAEWEYACRAGTRTPFNFGSKCNGEEANCDGSEPYGTTSRGPTMRRPTKVGSYQPNAFGLHDMHGNVSQWCQDWCGGDYYATSPTDDPQGPDSGWIRVDKGGNWFNGPVMARAAVHRGNVPGKPDECVGFRIVCEQ